jgi:lysophospholipase L1-like esterase
MLIALLAARYFLSTVETWSPPSYRAFSIIGDSITDGRGSDTDKNNRFAYISPLSLNPLLFADTNRVQRWPDLLLSRLQSSNDPTLTSLAVSNQAAGGNRILEDGLGPNVLSRINRDVLSHAGVKYAMIFEGVNDIGTADETIANQTVTYNRLISAYKQIATRIHAFNIPLFAARPSRPFRLPAATPRSSRTRAVRENRRGRK